MDKDLRKLNDLLNENKEEMQIEYAMYLKESKNLFWIYFYLIYFDIFEKNFPLSLKSKIVF
jgi:hypothetical protein